MDLFLDKLSVARGGVPLLCNVTWRLKPGQALILRGPNGSGKTTLLRTIAGLQPPLSGHCEGAEGRVAYGGHADGLKAMLSVAENLSFWAEVYGQRDITAALDAYHLTGLQDRFAGTLSAGQKRRAGLARLVVSGHPLWLLDEPTVSLDTDAVAMFAAAVTAHLDAGGLAIIATHIDLGIEAETLDLAQYRAAPTAIAGTSDEAFL